MIALYADERVKGRQISVETVKGTVVLRGKVDSDEAKTAAGSVAEGKNELTHDEANRDRSSSNGSHMPVAAMQQAVNVTMTGKLYPGTAAKLGMKRQSR